MLGWVGGGRGRLGRRCLVCCSGREGERGADGGTYRDRSRSAGNACRNRVGAGDGLVARSLQGRQIREGMDAVVYTFVAGDNGVHTFTNLTTLKTSGNQTITGTDTVTASITGTSGTIVVSPNSGGPLHYAVVAPASATAGTAFSITVTAKDQFNNTVTTYTGTVHFTSTDGAAVLPANYTFVAGDNGVHTLYNFNNLKTSGTPTVTGTDTTTQPTTRTPGNIPVNAA